METIWDKATKVIQEKLNKQNFDTWIKPIKIIELEDKCVRLAVPNKFFKDWLLDNYFPVIKTSLESVVGIELDVEFVLSKDKEKKVNLTNTNHEVEDAAKTAPPVSVRTGNSSPLNINYTFERFVVGPCNQFAHAASIAVAKQPAKNYNPLFLYGGSGLG
ncbi:MAG: DnaA N-terminal domain-containing protein, partial [Smithellaceae bacterium]